MTQLANIIEGLLPWVYCTREELEKLTLDELQDLDCVDINWCDGWQDEGHYDAYTCYEDAVKSAYTAQYEQIMEIRYRDDR